MARPAKLKVYRTAIGFHDAYVAAPSQKAALEAWGSGKDLFARGAAEVVTDPALTEVALARPGEIVRRFRGTAAEQMAALPAGPSPRARRPKDPPSRTTPGSGSGETPKRAKARAKPLPPPPSRAAPDAADAALEEASGDARAAIADLERREAALVAERRRMTAAQAEERSRLESARDAEAARYDRAVARWRDR